jgi:ABC-type multidrug transport system permease subunit
VSSFPLAILWISASGCGLYLLVLMLQSAAGSERMANMLTNFVLLPLTMLGGGFVPFDWMPRGLARLGHFTPNGWSVVQLQAILAGPAEPWRFGALAVFLAAAWFGSARVIRSKMC